MIKSTQISVINLEQLLLIVVWAPEISVKQRKKVAFNKDGKFSVNLNMYESLQFSKIKSTHWGIQIHKTGIQMAYVFLNIFKLTRNQRAKYK